MDKRAQAAIALHKKLQGKLSISSKKAIRSLADLSLLYTPGVGAVSKLVAHDPKAFREMTIQGNTVAVISDGSAVLGFGDLGARGAVPVLEGKCAIFKEFAGINAFPIALATQDTDQIVETICAIAPIFGGINLEDISAPRCFEIESRLIKRLEIPVMHDDQHGTAIVVLAALKNASRVVAKKFEQLKVVINGAGPAGTAVTRLLLRAGIKDIVVLDSQGTLHQSRKGIDGYKKELAHLTNPRKIDSGLEMALVGADVFIGVSRAGALDGKFISMMSRDPIIFALANPVPEIMPDEALAAGATIVATGRSDFPNQINNALVFPGVFRGALDHRVHAITEDMKIKAAGALAALIKKPTKNRIIPSILDKKVVPAIARAIR